MKIVLDIKLDKDLKENDIIVYKNGSWTVISKESFLAKSLNDQRLENAKLEEHIKKLQNDLVNLAKIVKEK